MTYHNVSRFIQGVACVTLSFPFFIAKYYSVVWIHHIFLIHLLVDEDLSCFHSLTIMNNAAMKIRVQVFVWAYVFVSLSCIHLGVELLVRVVTLCLTF